VTDHERYVDAPTFNLEHWQTAGLGVMSPRAWALFEYTGGAFVLYASGEAWDPAGAIVPALARTGAGVYTMTYAATGADEAGNAVPIGLVAGMASVQVTGADHTATAVPQANGYVVDVDIKNAGGIAQDHKVLVVLW
jgi:hypothetical protein